MAYPENSTEYLVVTLPWIIVIIGVIGNTFSAIVMLRKRFRSKNIGVYLLALAILDTIFLLSNSLFLRGFRILFDIDLQAVSHAGCALAKFVIYASRAMSAWVLVVLTVERMLALAIPHLSYKIITKKRAIISVMAVVIIQGLIYSYNFTIYEVHERLNICHWKDMVLMRRFLILINIADFLNYSLIPSVVMATSNTVLIYLLSQSKELRASKSQSGDDLRRTTLIIVTTSIAFILLTMPLSVYLILDVTMRKKSWPDYVQPLLYSINLINHSINFLLYCVSASNVRSEVKDMFCSRSTCCRSRSGYSIQSRSSYVSQQDQTVMQDIEFLQPCTVDSNGRETVGHTDVNDKLNGTPKVTESSM